MITDVPRGLIRLRDGKLFPRRSGWLEPGEQPVCPFGHRIVGTNELQEGVMKIACKTRLVPEGRDGSGFRIECGSVLYVATGAIGRYCFDVSEDEDTQIKKLGIKPTGVARFLGIHFPK